MAILTINRKCFIVSLLFDGDTGNEAARRKGHGTELFYGLLFRCLKRANQQQNVNQPALYNKCY